MVTLPIDALLIIENQKISIFVLFFNFKKIHKILTHKISKFFQKFQNFQNLLLKYLLVYNKRVVIWVLH